MKLPRHYRHTSASNRVNFRCLHPKRDPLTNVYFNHYFLLAASLNHLLKKRDKVRDARRRFRVNSVNSMYEQQLKWTVNESSWRDEEIQSSGEEYSCTLPRTTATTSATPFLLNSRNAYMADTVAVIYSTCAFTVYPSLVVSVENTNQRTRTRTKMRTSRVWGGKKSVRES